MRILLADAQTRVRSALRLLLENEVEECVIDEAGTAAEVLYLVPTIRPDVILLDWNLPGPAGAGLISAVKSEYPHTAVIVMDSRPQVAEVALGGGADGFVSKNDPPERVIAVIARALAANDLR
jgi:DNA-binding NarL/FixJ family response regulator